MWCFSLQLISCLTSAFRYDLLNSSSPAVFSEYQKYGRSVFKSYVRNKNYGLLVFYPENHCVPGEDHFHVWLMCLRTQTREFVCHPGSNTFSVFQMWAIDKLHSAWNITVEGNDCSVLELNHPKYFIHYYYLYFINITKPTDVRP